MKRIFKEVSVQAGPDGWQILLDAAVLLTPAKAPLRLPSAGLAQAVADEWRSQGETVRPATMPITRLANTAQDLAAKRRPELVDQLASYAGTDLLCYRAEGPSALVERQRRHWQPLLDWAALQYDAVLEVVSGLMPKAQAAAPRQALRRAVEACDDWRLTALQTATTASGSLVIGLALIEGRIDAAVAFEAAQVDETYQIEQWGCDPEQERRRAGLRAEFEACRRFVALLAA